MIKPEMVGLLKIFLVVLAVVIVLPVATAVVIRTAYRSTAPFLFPLGVGEVLVLGVVLLLILFICVGIAVFVYHDAKRRGMEPLLWALVAALVPYLLGLVAYLVFRHPIQRTCPSCGLPFAATDVFCKHCGHVVQAQCKSCQRPMSPDARFCPVCGTPLTDAPSA